jgi:hypothetical protein
MVGLGYLIKANQSIAQFVPRVRDMFGVPTFARGASRNVLAFCARSSIEPWPK